MPKLSTKQIAAVAVSAGLLIGSLSIAAVVTYNVLPSVKLQRGDQIRVSCPIQLIFAWGDSGHTWVKLTCPSPSPSPSPSPTPAASSTPSISPTASSVSRIVTLMWTPPPDDGGSPIIGYNIYRSTSPGNEILIQGVGVVTSYIDNTVAPGVTYYYRIAAVNAIGTSNLSNELSVTT